MCLPPGGPLLDNPLSPELTRRGRRCAGVPLANPGELDSLQISDTRFGPPPLRPVAAHDNTSRNWACPARSRMKIEILVFDFGKRGWILFVVRPGLIQQSAEFRPRTAITYNSIPSQVAVQLGQESRQIFDQFFALERRKRANRIFNFMGRTHLLENTTRGRSKQPPVSVKFAKRLVSHATVYPDEILITKIV
jgi:hypothetical protein